MPASDRNVFLRSEALAEGLSRRRVDGQRFGRPFPGVRLALPEDVPDNGYLALWQRCRWYAPRLRPGQYLSHGTALAVRGVPVPQRVLGELHVSAHRPLQAPRVAGVSGHRLQARPVRIDTVGGVPVLAPSSAWVQVLGDWQHDDLVAAADRIVTPRDRLATLDELRGEAVPARRTRRAERVLADVREGSESPRETQLRLLMLRAGLPEPELAYELWSDAAAFIARLDMAYPQYRVAVEYDGRQHARDAAQFERDADRWHDVREAGWELVRVLNHHLVGRGAVALERIATALRRGGWTG